MKFWRPILLALLASHSAFASERLVVDPVHTSQAALGIFAYPEGRSNIWPKIYMVVVNDRGQSLPSVYLDYDYTLSDATQPWSASEFAGMRQGDGTIALKRRHSDFAILDFSNEDRTINGQTIPTSCAFYDAPRQAMTAYCPPGDHTSLTLRDTAGNLLASMAKDGSSQKWLLELGSTLAADELSKAKALTLAGLKLAESR